MKGPKPIFIDLESIQSFNQNAELQILKGSVLLTEAGNLIDHVLKAGQCWKVKRNSKVVVEPLEQGTCLQHKAIGNQLGNEFRNWVFVENWGMVRLSK
jgi:hypothetical protein